MQVNRKDTILVAVLVNVGLLAVLFVSSLSYEETSTSKEIADSESVIEHEYARQEPVPIETSKPSSVPVDEVDQVLQDFASTHEEKVPRQKPESEEKTIEITVKRGDALEKIARHNRTTPREIKRLNNLKSDRLQIGQVLKIPLPDPVALQASAPKTTGEKEVWYDVQNGDNPWKIAKKFQVSYAQILRLNNLDESNARAIRPGNKIRIK